MSHWRSLFYLSLLVLTGHLANAAQIQGQPVGVLYNLQGGSWDAFNKYPASASNSIPLNGQRLGNISHLGAKWNRSQYVDGPNAFGVIAFDQYGPVYSPAYANGQLLNGLNAGNGAWSGFYVVQTAAFPAITFDQMTNYVNGVNVQGLNAGNNNGSFLAWFGSYQDVCADPLPLMSYFGGIASAGITEPGYDTIYVTFDGTTPAPSGTRGNASSIPAGATPTGTWTYDGPLTIPWTNTVFTAVQGHGSIGFCLAGFTNITFDFGENWSNNVVANGGANPSAASVAVVNTFGAVLNNDLLLNQNAAVPSISGVNLFAPDSLIAAITPQIYYAGNQPWVNHSFIAGDLTVNGLAGNGTSKYLDTGANANVVAGSFDVGLSVYAYTVVNGVTTDIGNFVNGGGTGAGSVILATSQSGNSISEMMENISARISVPAAGNGFFTANRTANNSSVLYFANSGSAFASIGTDSTVTANTVESGNIFVFAVNFSGASQFTASTLSFAEFGRGLSSGRSQSLFNRVQTARTSFGGGFR